MTNSIGETPILITIIYIISAKVSFIQIENKLASLEKHCGHRNENLRITVYAHNLERPTFPSTVQWIFRQSISLW